MSVQPTEVSNDPYDDPSYFGPSLEQIEADGEDPVPLPDDIERALNGEQVEFPSDNLYVFQGGTPEQPSCYEDVNHEVLAARASDQQDEEDAPEPSAPRFTEETAEENDFRDEE